MTLRVGEVFAGYTVVGQLGGGGMGDVYLAQHPRLPRQDALKILKADISADEGFRQRFIREADSVAALSHPNIVTVFDRGEFDGKLWIATQYVDGTDAAQLLRDRYPAGMPAMEAATIAAAIGDALDYAHERGLLHRDVKPANILLSDPGRDGRRRVFLADFGIARPIGDPSGLTATNFTVGTVSYAAPEQLMGADIDGRADQYALAATAFHLLTGKPPFEDSNPIAVISKHLTQPPPQLGALRADLSGLDHILATAMAKDPDQRYPDCADFTADLTHGASLNPVLPHAPTQAAVPAPVPSTPVPGPPAAATQSAASYAAERAVRDAGPRDDWADARHLASEEEAPPLAPGGRNRTSGDRRGLKLLLAGSAAALLVLATLGTLGVFQRSDPPQSGPRSELPVAVDVGELVIGTKFDQPGLGLQNPDGTMSGFDVDVAKYVAKELGYDENQIIWKEAPSSQREALIESDQVEYVVATYTITDRRKERVDFAGPYLITGQGLLIAAANTEITGPDSLQNNKKLCSVTGSTPAQRIKDKYPGVQLQQYETYSACVEALKNGAVDAVTTDEVILAGYAAQYPGAFKLTGQTFSEERYGIGLKKGDTELRAKINDALAKMEKDGAWQAAFDKNLGPAGVSAPAPPPIDRY